MEFGDPSQFRAQGPAEGEVLAVDPEAAGLRILADLGLDAAHVGSIQLSAGGNCVGNLATFIGTEKHAHIRDAVVETARTAVETGADPDEAVVRSLGIFVLRDEQKQPVRSGDEKLKKK